MTDVPASTVFGEPRRTVLPVSEPVRRKRLWASQETADLTREVALRQRLEVQQAVAAAIAAPTPAPPAVAAPEAPEAPDATTAAEEDATAAAEADAAADAEANAMLPDNEDADPLIFALADAADAAVNAAAEAAELAAADTEVETDTEAHAMTTAFTYGTSHAAGHWTEETESATLGSSDEGPASDNESLGTLPPGLTEPEPPTDSASEAPTESTAEAANDSATESAAADIATAPSTGVRQPRIILVIRRAAPRPVMLIPAPLVRTTSFLPLSPVLPTGQYNSPIVIDDDGADADDEDDEETLFPHHDSDSESQ